MKKTSTCRKCGKEYRGASCSCKPKKKIESKPLSNRTKRKIYAKKKRRINKKSKDERKKLIERLDRVFSQFIRLSNADANEYVECFTCGEKHHWKKIQNGHFIPRGVMVTRWDESNCKPQCNNCNSVQGGNLEVYCEKLEDDCERLKVLSNSTKYWTIAQIQEMIDKYKKLKEKWN